MELTDKLHKCNTGDHELIEILNCDVGYGAEYVVRWCRVCGCVVVDEDVDGRTMKPGGHMKMIGPQITKLPQIYFGSHEE